MCGRAIVAIVVSMACMIEAAMTLAVISTRLRGRAGACGSSVLSAAASAIDSSLLLIGFRNRDALDFRRRIGRIVVREARAFLVVRVDLHRGAQAREQRVLPVRVVDLDAYGETLHDFDPVARRVLRWPHGELRARAG